MKNLKYFLESSQSFCKVNDYHYVNKMCSTTDKDEIFLKQFFKFPYVITTRSLSHGGNVKFISVYENDPNTMPILYFYAYEDEWYIVKYLQVDYKCDQYTGVEECLVSLGFNKK